MNKQQINELRPYVDALLGANAGISELQARTMVYYACATFYDEIDPFPLLCIKSSFGCGKSDLLETLLPMCKDAQRIEGETYATIRNELENCRTAFIDEHEDLPEKLLSKRFKKSNAGIYALRPLGKGYLQGVLNIFGATVIATRHGFKDGALNSRCLTIEPKYVENCKCSVTNVGNLLDVVNQLGALKPVLKSGRVSQVWRPLEGVAKTFNDDEWIEWAKEEVGVNMRAVDFNRQFEPTEAVLMAVEVCRKDGKKSIDRSGSWYKLSFLREVISGETELELKSQQIGEILIRKGFNIASYHGYQAVKIKRAKKRRTP